MRCIFLDSVTKANGLDNGFYTHCDRTIGPFKNDKKKMK